MEVRYAFWFFTSNQLLYLHEGIVFSFFLIGCSSSPIQCLQWNTCSGSQVCFTSNNLVYVSSSQSLFCHCPSKQGHYSDRIYLSMFNYEIYYTNILIYLLIPYSKNKAEKLSVFKSASFLKLFLKSPSLNGLKSPFLPISPKRIVT